MSLFDIFSSKPAEAAARAKSAGYQQGQEAAFGQIDQGVDQASGYYDKAAVPFASLFDRGTKGYDAYQDATGINGADGLARAKSTFTSLPGYTEGINMALDQNDRRAAARGMLGSGNDCGHDQARDGLFKPEIQRLSRRIAADDRRVHGCRHGSGGRVAKPRQPVCDGRPEKGRDCL